MKENMQQKFLNLLEKEFLGKKYENFQDLEDALNSALKKLYDDGKIKKLLKANIAENGKPYGNLNNIAEVLEIVERKMNS